MTIVSTGAVATFGTAGVLSGAITGATTGSATGLGRFLATRTSNAALIAGAMGASGSAGAILGAAVGGTGWTAVKSAVAGGAAGVVSCGIASTMAASFPALLTGPVGWLVLGVTPDPNPVTQTCTFDCWKPILRDSSEEPSRGVLLRDIFEDPRIKQVNATATKNDSGFPEIILDNVWNERFRIEYVMLPTSEIAAHAVPFD